MTEDEKLKFMKDAIEMEKKSVSEKGKLSPKVGAVLVKDVVKLGEAHRGELGDGDHAEYTLFEKKLNGQDISGAILFTTLEPCTSRNKHKPCSDWIIEKKIGKVYIGLLDPNPKIYNKGALNIQQSGIEVDYFPIDLRQSIEGDNKDFIYQFHANPELEGKASFDYSNNDGVFIIGHGDYQFDTKWTKASDKSIHAYRDPQNIDSISEANGYTDIGKIKDGSIFNNSSRTRTIQKDGILIVKNKLGHYAAVKILDIMDNTRPGNNRDELTIEFKILTDKKVDFSR